MSYANFRFNLQKYARYNPETGDLVVPGNLTVDGGANIPGLPIPDIAPVSTTDLIGNILSGSYVSVSGNIMARNFVGNGAFLTNLTVELPGNISADVIGNLTGPKMILSGNASANLLVGNASRMSGVVVAFPSTGIADVRGNVFAPGNVNAANVSANSFVVYGNVFANSMTITGNVYSEQIIGNGFFLTDTIQVFPTSAAIDITGNVVAPGNVDAVNVASYNVVTGNVVANTIISSGNIVANTYSGNASGIFGVIPKTLNSEIFGNITASGNVAAQYLKGNGTAVSLSGYTIIPRGNVADLAARLSLSSALPGSLVYQIDAQVTYMLLGTPATVATNWLQFTGANFPVTSVFGRTGNIQLLSNVDVKTIGGANIAAPGSMTSATMSVLGNVTGHTANANVVIAGNVVANVIRANTLNVTGNIVAWYITGNGMLLESVQSTVPTSGPIDITGNVKSLANVDTQLITTTILTVGNAFVNGQVNAANVYANLFIGNGFFLTGTPASGNQPVNIIGNVSSPGNVDAANVTSGILRTVDFISIGQINVIGNVFSSYFIGDGSRLVNIPATVTGTQSINVSGNVVSSANVDATNVSVTLVRAANIVVTGQLQSTSVTANITADYFMGNGSGLTGVSASLGGTQSVNVIGNVTASANVDASNVSTRILRTVGNINVRGQVNVVGNVVALNYYGSGAGLTGVGATATGNQFINIVGNVTSTANVDASNITANIIRVFGNTTVGGQVNIIGNVTVSNRLIGNGALLTGIVYTGNQSTNIVGNVNANANVNAQNVVTLSLRAVSNILVVGQANVVGNIVSAGGFVGDGSLLQGITFGSTGSPLPSFVPPVTGFSTTTPSTLSYSNTGGWSIALQHYTSTPITITTYNMPTSPDAPFINLPANVTQRMTTPFSFANGVWSGVCTLFSTDTFDSRPISMGYNSGYGILGGNSSATNANGIYQVSFNGLTDILNGSTLAGSGDFWPHPTMGTLWTFIMPISSPVTVLGQSFPVGQLYFLEMTKNANYLISWHQVTSPNGNVTYQRPGTPISTYAHFVSETEVYVIAQPVVGAQTQNPTIYDQTCQRGSSSVGSIYIARINPTARTCQWITPMTYSVTANWASPSMSRNSQGTILHWMSYINTSTGGSVTIGNITGNVFSVSVPSGPILRYFGMGLFPSNGAYIANTLYTVCGASADSNEVNIPSMNADRWDGLGQVVYIAHAYQGSPALTIQTWNGSVANTWTLKTSITPQKTDSSVNGGQQPIIFRQPLGNVNSPWSGVTVTQSPYSQTDIQGGRSFRVGAVIPSNNGNVFFGGQSLAGNANAGFTYTLGTATSPTYGPSGISFPVFFKFQDTNGTFSNYATLSSISSSDGGGTSYGGGFVYNNCTGFKVPGSNTSVRFLSVTNIGNLVINGTVGANMVNIANSVAYPLMIEFNSSMVLSNFRGQSPLISNPSSVDGVSSGAYVAPAADNNYNIYGGLGRGPVKMGNV